MKESGRKGFTLVEILVVAAIIAILMGVAVINLFGARTRGLRVEAEACARAIQNAQEVYRIDANTYTTDRNRLRQNLLTPCTLPGMSYTITSANQDSFSATVTYTKGGSTITLRVSERGLLP